MGFFQDLFKNPLGTVANTVAAPFQSAGNILNGKGNIGDLLGIATMFMPGGNFTSDIAKWGTKNIGLSSLVGQSGLSGLGDMSKWQPKDFAQLLPLFLSGSQGQPNAGGFQIPGGLGDMAGKLSEADFMSLLMRLPMRNAALDRAYQGLSESGTRATANSLGNQVQARGAEAGMANANSLLSRGYGSGVADSARLQGRNQGVQQANNISASLLGPQNQAQNALMQSQVYSPGNLQGGGLNSLLALQNAGNSQRIADTQYNASRPPTFLETLLGVGGQVLPHILNPQSSNTVTGTKAGSKAGNVWLGTKAGKK